MPGETLENEGSVNDANFGWRASGFTLTLHTLGLAVATWPLIRTFPFQMPLHEDSLGSLWLFRWYKACLFEGQSVWFCKEVLHPAGVPMGSYTPMYLQSLIFSFLSTIIHDDVICWNILWLIGMLGTGLGTSLLAWHLIGDRACAAFAGLMMVLSTPMLILSNFQIELIYVGGFPLFLVAWMRFVDRPGVRRMLAASFTYLLVAMTCGYYMVFSIFPAVLYLVWTADRRGWRTAWSWLKSRLPLLAGMAGLTLAGVLVIDSAQVWMIVQGFPSDRPRAMFDLFAAPLWSYVVPSPWQRLGSLLPTNPYVAIGDSASVKMSYLGLVTMGLMGFAAIRRGGLRRASFVWLAFAMMVMLSLGASAKIAGREITLPAGWLWAVFPPIRMTRLICRFSMFAMVFGGVLAGGGLKLLLSRLPGRGGRAAVFTGLAIISVVDLSLAGITFPRGRIPEAPGCYAFLLKHDPKGAILEIPEGRHGFIRNALCTYWQSYHRLKTSVGIMGVPNENQDGRAYFNSPFFPALLDNPRYLETPESFDILLMGKVDFNDYLWLYLTVNDFDYIVIHQGSIPFFGGMPPKTVDRVMNILGECKIYEDSKSIVYARSRLRRPSHPVAINLGAWSKLNAMEGRLNSPVSRSTRIAVYNPEPDRSVQITLDAASARGPLSVRLRSKATDLESWNVASRQFQTLVSAPIRLSAGLNELTIETTRPYVVARDQAAVPSDENQPYHLYIARLNVQAAPESLPLAERAPGIQPSGESKVR